ncbi:hypothetical protein [Methanimicrococcus stummii]|uniref:hypothetical protein n=1 Tax=Methanimicrococcus stummii TaxID=3028294 RepID=UPI0029318D13|nr:hypothetical protein [Methanimicrococcus sp. Es2]
MLLLPYGLHLHMHLLFFITAVRFANVARLPYCFRFACCLAAAPAAAAPPRASCIIFLK